MSDTRPLNEAERALAIAQIYIGVAMARAAGVECGSPTNIRFAPIERDTMKGERGK